MIRTPPRVSAAPERNRAWWAPRSARSLSRSADSRTRPGRARGRRREARSRSVASWPWSATRASSSSAAWLAQLGDLRQGRDPAADHPGLGQRDLTGGQRRTDRRQLGGLASRPAPRCRRRPCGHRDVGEEVLGRGPPDRLGAAGLLEAFGHGDQRTVHDRLQPAQRHRGLEQVATPPSPSRCRASAAAAVSRAVVGDMP